MSYAAAVVEDLPESDYAVEILGHGGQVENEAASADPGAVVDGRSEGSSAASLGLVLMWESGEALLLEGDPPNQLSRMTKLDEVKDSRPRHGSASTEPSDWPGSYCQFGTRLLLPV